MSSATWIQSLEAAIAQDPAVQERYCPTLPRDRITREQEFAIHAVTPSEFARVVADIKDDQRSIKYWSFSIVRTFSEKIEGGRRSTINWRGFTIAFDDHADSSEGEEAWFAGLTFDDDSL
jgi:hypothetical protein